MKTLIVTDINDQNAMVIAIIQEARDFALLNSINGIEGSFQMGMLTENERNGQIISAACNFYGGVHFTKS